MTIYTLESSREWYNNLPGKRTSAAMVIRHNDTYLMIKDDYKPDMNFPSGIIDPGESAKTAAIRETMEEVGLTFDPDQVKFLSVSYIAENNGFHDRFQFYFMADVDDIVANSLVLEEGVEEHRWVTATQISKLSFRAEYKQLSTMLDSGNVVPYFEV